MGRDPYLRHGFACRGHPRRPNRVDARDKPAHDDNEATIPLVQALLDTTATLWLEAEKEPLNMC
jgi:hypothetical protein